MVASHHLTQGQNDGSDHLDHGGLGKRACGESPSVIELRVMPKRSMDRRRAEPTLSLRHLPAAKRQAPDGLRPRVAKVMEERDLTAEELAQAIGAETQFVRDLARGRVLRIRLQNYPVMRAIATHVHVPFDDLYPQEWLEWLDRRLFSPRSGVLERARVRQGLDIRDLAQQAGLPEYLVQLVERGENPWHSRRRALKRLTPVARRLGLKPIDILHGMSLPDSRPLARRGSMLPSLPAGWPRLWAWRVEAHLTRRGLAHKAHVTTAILKELEHGRGVGIGRLALMVDLEHIAAALGRSNDEVATPPLLDACLRARAAQKTPEPPDQGWPDLRGLRKKAGLGLTDLAHKAGMTRTLLEPLERGLASTVEAPRLEGMLLRLARVLGTHPEALATPALLDACAKARQAAGTEEAPNLPTGWPPLWAWRNRAGYSVWQLARAVRAQGTDLQNLERGRPIGCMASTVRALAIRLAGVLDRPVSEVYTPALMRACAERRAASGLHREWRVEP